MARSCDYCMSEIDVELCHCGVDACADCRRGDVCFDCADRDEMDGESDEPSDGVSIEVDEHGNGVARAPAGVDLRDVLPRLGFNVKGGGT